MTLRANNFWAAVPFLSVALIAAPIAAAMPAAEGDSPKLLPAAPPSPDVIQAQPAVLALPAAPADEVVPAPAPAVATSDPDEREVECLAKVIVHEAGGESHRGQVAVAQVVRARIKDGRFGDDACSVARQRGQFFDVDAYHPAQDGARWSNAVAIATETLSGDGDDVAPGALFFHAVSSGMPNRVRVAQIGGHVFYR